MKKAILFLATVMIALTFAGPAKAAIVSGTLPVTAEVLAACSVTTTPVNFGTFGGTQVDADGGISVTCSEGVPFGIKAHGGNAFNPLTQQRQMTSAAGNTIGYQLFKEAARTNIWGSCRGFCPLQATAVESVGTGTLQAFTVFGRAFASASVPPNGMYTDSVLVEVEF